MSEKDIENLLKKHVKNLGGVAYKFVSPGMTGVPDRLVLLPGNRIGFVEVKAPGKRPRPDQEYQIKRLAGLGCRVYVLDDPRCIDSILEDIAGVEEEE